MKILNVILFSTLLLTLTTKAETGNMYKQTVRGTVIDQDSKTPIIGANVIIIGSDPIMGSSTDLDGNFRIDDVPVGRIMVQISYLGYEKKTIPNIVVGSGKETVMSIEILESIIKLDDITVKATSRKQEALNEMATVSAKVFTVEETKRYAGTFNDPARMVSSFAGVTGDPSGNNDIIVRGNSPRGILWKLEGVEIPNPNHFADEGASGGPINALNSAMLANSDFFSGAFAPEYGNAYSGVFDMKLRSGNNEKREYSFSGGALGFDGTMEGPFKPGYGGSYLINYRYSSLGVLDDLGIVDFFGVPKYQDVSFKFNFPTKNAGSFSLFGLGGLSGIAQKAVDENNEDYVREEGKFTAGLGVVGLSHTYPINDKTFVKNMLSVSGTQNQANYSERNSNGEMVETYHDKFENSNYKLSSCFNTKINARNRIKAGVVYTGLNYDVFEEYDDKVDGNFTTGLNTEGNSGLLQGYVNWKHRLNDDLTLISGIHYMHFLFNDSKSLEPRLGMEYRFSPLQSFTLGFGLHSKVENLSVYNVQVLDNNNDYIKPNTKLELAKSLHMVAGYKHQFTPNLHFKTEVYYQHLYDVAVENDANSPFVLNNYMSGYTDRALVNEGIGRNYGLEMTLERFFANQFYFLATASVFDSKFTAMDNVEHNSRFNSKYASNFLIGKEFNIGDESKNRTISINAKGTFIGGAYYTPINLEASIADGQEVLDMANYLNKKADNVFKADVAVSYRRDRKKTTHEFKIDVQNVSNNQAVVDEYYDSFNQVIEKSTQWTIFPNVIYTIQF
ncbi:MAG: TonB-dependent receptor [Salinivirgaceae bacterium]|jgi:hypothetical protein|nr:TonB-dependent receptor [Salinivirgaceae bacterium]